MIADGLIVTDVEAGNQVAVRGWSAGKQVGIELSQPDPYPSHVIWLTERAARAVLEALPHMLPPDDDGAEDVTEDDSFSMWP